MNHQENDLSNLYSHLIIKLATHGDRDIMLLILPVCSPCQSRNEHHISVHLLPQLCMSTSIKCNLELANNI